MTPEERLAVSAQILGICQSGLEAFRTAEALVNQAAGELDTTGLALLRDAVDGLSTTFDSIQTEVDDTIDKLAPKIEQVFDSFTGNK